MTRLRAFTLIEILITIGIITLLSAVILVSLNAARASGTERAITMNLRNMVPEADIVYDSTNSYATLANCSTSGNPFYKFSEAITKLGGTLSCTGTTDSWTATVAYPTTNPTKSFSVSANGVVSKGGPPAPVSPWGNVVQGNWYSVHSQCVAQGGRLPTQSELLGAYAAHGGGLPPGFDFGWYWTSDYWEESDGETIYVYTVYMATGNQSQNNSSSVLRTRCWKN